MAYRPLLLGTRLIGRLLGANMNSTSDQPITWLIPANTKWIPRRITIANRSASLGIAAGGIYTAAAKSGTAIVAAAQLYSGLGASPGVLDLTIASTTLRTDGGLYLALTTAVGSPATADLYIIADVIG